MTFWYWFCKIWNKNQIKIFYCPPQIVFRKSLDTYFTWVKKHVEFPLYVHTMLTIVLPWSGFIIIDKVQMLFWTFWEVIGTIVTLKQIQFCYRLLELSVHFVQMWIWERMPIKKNNFESFISQDFGAKLSSMKLNVWVLPRISKSAGTLIASHLIIESWRNNSFDAWRNLHVPEKQKGKSLFLSLFVTTGKRKCLQAFEAFYKFYKDKTKVANIRCGVLLLTSTDTFALNCDKTFNELLKKKNTQIHPENRFFLGMLSETSSFILYLLILNLDGKEIPFGPLLFSLTCFKTFIMLIIVLLVAQSDCVLDDFSRITRRQRFWFRNKPQWMRNTIWICTYCI